MTNTKGTKRARQIERRRLAQRRKMVRNVSLITGLAILLVAVFIWAANRPVGDIVVPEPKDRPQFSGKTLGDPNAPIVMEVFEDFQCPACRVFTEDVEPAIISDYVETGQVYLVYRQYAFIGLESYQASNASMCAADQDRFWDYHDMLFANQTGENIGAFADRRLTAFAETLGLDMEAFQACFDSNQFENDINEDIALGRGYNISGTPTVVINGSVVPNFAYEMVSQAIQIALLGQ